MAGKTPNWVCEPDAELPIKVGADGPAALAPLTVPQLFKQNCAKYGDKIALNVKRDGKWEATTYAQWYEQSVKLAKSLLAIGLKRFQGVSIMGFNSPEWMIANIGTILAGGLATGIYATNNLETTRYILENSCCRVAFGGHSLLLEQLLEAGKGVDGMKVVQYVPGPVEQSLKEKGVLSWDEFLQLGKDVKSEDVESVMSSQKPGQCCTLIYTSGTTGMPKGVMLSHDNCTWTTAVLLVDTLKFTSDASIVSYLPLSHIAGQALDIYCPIQTGCKVFFAQPDALKGTLVETLKEVEPTHFFGVPRVWEKMKEKIEPAFKAGKVPAADVKQVLGLGKSELLLTGSAPTPLEVLEFFKSVNMPIYNLYGCSENTGPATVSTKDANKLGSVGKNFVGTETRIDKPYSDGEGELCLKGRYVLMGYLKSPDKTKDVIDEDGWYHTGDIARIDKEGFVWITGRLKELIITSGGENIAPVSIEQEMKKELRLCSYCIVVGDARKYLGMLVTLKSKIDEKGLATDELDDEAVGICKGLGVEVSKVSEAMESVPVKKYIQEGMNRANGRAISNTARVQKYGILPRDLSIPAGDLTPTAKLKRGHVAKKYAEVIELLYK